VLAIGNSYGKDRNAAVLFCISECVDGNLYDFLIIEYFCVCGSFDFEQAIRFCFPNENVIGEKSHEKVISESRTFQGYGKTVRFVRPHPQLFPFRRKDRGRKQEENNFSFPLPVNN
jgi:hypothetical protein